jgi:hypothetical protein
MNIESQAKQTSKLDAHDYHTLQQKLDEWQQSDGDVPPIREMSAALQDILAKANIFTTSVGVHDADHPLSRRSYLEKRGYKKELEKIAKNVTRFMQNKPGFEDAAKTDEFGHNTLGSKLAKVFGAVTAIEGYNLHVIDKKEVDGKVADGTVVAERMIFTVSTADEARGLTIALQELLTTSNGDSCMVLPVTPTTKQEATGELFGVEVYGLDEHMARGLSRAVEALLIPEDRRNYGTELPHIKRSLKVWKEEGETFHPKVEQRLEKADQAYKLLNLTVTDKDKPHGIRSVDTNKQPDYHLLGTDAAPMLQGLRDIFNEAVIPLRGGSHRNPEQNPNKKARLRIEEDVDLKRDPAKPDDVKLGPLTARPLSETEAAQEKGREVARAVRKNPIDAGVKVAELAI